MINDILKYKQPTRLLESFDLVTLDRMKLQFPSSKYLASSCAMNNFFMDGTEREEKCYQSFVYVVIQPSYVYVGICVAELG